MKFQSPIAIVFISIFLFANFSHAMSTQQCKEYYGNKLGGSVDCSSSTLKASELEAYSGTYQKVGSEGTCPLPSQVSLDFVSQLSVMYEAHNKSKIFDFGSLIISGNNSELVNLKLSGGWYTHAMCSEHIQISYRSSGSTKTIKLQKKSCGLMNTIITKCAGGNADDVVTVRVNNSGFTLETNVFYQYHSIYNYLGETSPVLAEPRKILCSYQRR